MEDLTMRSQLFTYVLVLLLASHAIADNEILNWDELPALPDTIGYGGPFTGVHNGALIVAGGANFPNEAAWDGGKKAWHDNVYVLEKGDTAWNTKFKLPNTLAYGVSVSTGKGVLFIGGQTDGTDVSQVLVAKWDAEKKQLTIEELSSLPRAAAYTAGGMIGNSIFIAASHRSEGANRIDTKSFWTIALDDLLAGKDWQSLDPWPGAARHKMVAAVQSAGGPQKFLYLFSGSTPVFDADGNADLSKFEFFTDGYRFNPKTKMWQQIADIPVIEDIRDIDGKEAFANQRTPVAAATAIDFGQSHILVFSGATGRYITKPLKERPLFPTDVLAYHAITDTWITAGHMPQGVVTTTVTKWDGKIIIASGEIRPGVRTPKVQVATGAERESKFGITNTIVLVVYLGALVGIGAYFSKREKGTDDFFLAGKRIPWWAAGMSIYATQLSAITFIASPAVAYSRDWLVYPAKICIFIMAPIVIVFYLPFFRRLNVTTAYEYLERRFNVVVRLFGSASFILFQLGRMAIVVFLPALALSAITGINVYTCILIMGILSTVYTVLGGMEAVIWTDVLQTFVLWCGMLIGLIVVIVSEDGVGNIYNTAAADGKFHMFDWSFSFTELVTWSMFLGTFLLQFGPYTTDQSVIQRYLTTKDEKAAAKSIWTNGILAIPFGFMFFALGTCLYVYFKHHPELLSIGMQNDQVFPLFVAEQLPAGVSGLVIAGVFAASMSSMDSSMHSISTAVTTDFYRRFKPDAPDEKCLKLARRVIIFVGVLAMIIACALATYDIKSLFFFFQKLLGLLSSGLVGIFILGIFTKRANVAGALAGAIVCTGLLVYVVWFTNIHFYLYAAVGISTCVVVGYLVSVMTAGSTKDLSQLTLYTQRAAPTEQEHA